MKKGSVMSIESRDKMRAAALKRGSNRTGVKHTPESLARISRGRRLWGPKGEACHTFKDGKLSERRGERFSPEYKRWRYDVFLRDRFTCQRCGDDKGGNLRAHHIKPFAEFPELRFDVTNGETLCETCHKKEHAASPARRD